MIKNLKTTARKKVNAGVRVSIVEDREGELYSKPLYPHIRDENLFSQKSVPYMKKGGKKILLKLPLYLLASSLSFQHIM